MGKGMNGLSHGVAWRDLGKVRVKAADMNDLGNCCTLHTCLSLKCHDSSAWGTVIDAFLVSRDMLPEEIFITKRFKSEYFVTSVPRLGANTKGTIDRYRAVLRKSHE